VWLKMMLSHLARRSLLVTSRGFHIVRTVSVACNRKLPLVQKYYVLSSVNKPVYTICFRLTSDYKVTSGKKFPLEQYSMTDSFIPRLDKFCHNQDQ